MLAALIVGSQLGDLGVGLAGGVGVFPGTAVAVAVNKIKNL